MEKLFGIPVEGLLVGLTGALLAGLVLLAIIAGRNRVLFSVGARNIARRPAQTGLIILGLMLATLLVSASLVTGDTINYSIERSAVTLLGRTDLIVQPKDQEGTKLAAAGDGESQGRIDPRLYKEIEEALDSGELVDGVAPVLRESVPAAVPGTRRHLPGLELLGLTAAYDRSFNSLESDNGPLSVSALAVDEVYLSQEASEKLGAGPGDAVAVFTPAGPRDLAVAGVYTGGGEPAGGPAMVMSLAGAQGLLKTGDRFNAVLISGQGDAVAGARQTAAIEKELRPILRGRPFAADPVKRDALDEAKETGALFSSLFLVFGQFSMVAGIMLIFLIFVMLAAERKVELGVMRALGAQRRDLLKVFVFEGALYALLAGVIGVLAGIGVGWLMVKIMTGALAIDNFTLSFHFNPRSAIIAYAIGGLATFFIVVLSAWRVGRINIVRAIRDLPEPQKGGLSGKWLALLLATLLLGVVVTFEGLAGEQRGTLGLGLSLIVVAAPLLARWVRLPDRAAFTVAGVGLMAIWLAPDSVFTVVVPGYEAFSGGLELFFLAGLAGVTGAVWAVMYNSDLLLAAVSGLFGRIKGVAPVLRIAVHYPMKNRVRTGLALAMFSLVVFTLVFMSSLLASMKAVYDDTATLSGGYDIQGVTGYTNPVRSIDKTLAGSDQQIGSDDLEAVGSFAMAPVGIRQPGLKDKDWTDFVLRGIDADYADSVNYGFHLRAAEYRSDREVWRALVEEPNLAVVHSGLVPAKVNLGAGDTGKPWLLSGLFREDRQLPELYIEARNPLTGASERLRVIGIVNEMSFGVFDAIVTSQETVDDVMGAEIPATVFWFKLRPGLDIDRSAQMLATAFYEHGMETETLEKAIAKITGTSRLINRLLQGFMGLGLVVGIAALGVIAARSVVERRRQIGMVRAIGFGRRMVQSTFILETSFVALLGITLGSVLGLTLSEKVSGFIAKDMPDFVFQVPWVEVGAIAGAAYAAALLTTYLPARRASRIYPADALRYE